jgi:hypothetical protein
MLNEPRGSDQMEGQLVEIFKEIYVCSVRFTLRTNARLWRD